MKFFLFSRTTLSLASTLGCLASLQAETKVNRVIPPVDPAKTALVDQALPAGGVAVAKPRRILVSARTEGFYHESIPTGLYALEALGKKTGAFTVEVNHEMSAFSAENLARFDGILLLSTTQLKFEQPEHRQALLDFVRVHGKGLIGIHAASDNFPTWPEGQGLMGGIFHSHPWLSGDTVAVKLDEPSHPLVSSFGGRGFWVRDEIYQIVGPYGRDRQRVLLSLDMSKPENARPAEKLVRTDGDFPIAWAKQEGKGRVFYSSLGHNDTVFWDTKILSHFLAGIQYGLGDLAAPDAPSSTLNPAPKPALAVNQAPLTLDLAGAKALVSIAEGDEPAIVRGAEASLRSTVPLARRDFFRLVAQAAQENKPTPSALRALSHLLGLYGSESEVALLTQWIDTLGAGEPAVQALGQIGGTAAGESLTALLGRVAAPLRLPVINALATAKGVSAVPALIALAQGADTNLAAAAIDALAHIATPEAVRALQAAAKSSESTAWALVSSALNASSLPTAERVNLLQGVASSTNNVNLKAAAYEAILALDESAAPSVVLPALADVAVGARLVNGYVKVASHNGPALQALLKAFPTLPSDIQGRVLAVAEQLAKPSLYPLASAGLTLPNSEHKAQAMLAVAATATRLNEIKPLIEALASADTRAIATQGLSRARIAELDTDLRARAEGATAPALLASLLTISSNRGDSAIMPLVLRSAKSEQAEVRGAAFRALAPLVRGEDLDTLFGLRAQLKTAAERRAWQDATVAAIRFRNDTDVVVNLLSEKLPTAVGFERATYSVALVNINTPAAIAAVEKELADPDVERRKEVIRALSGARIMPSGRLLIGAAEKAKDSSEKILALRGFLDVLLANPELGIEDRVSSYKRAWAVAERREEQGAIIAVVPSLWNEEGRRFGAEILAKYHGTK